MHLLDNPIKNYAWGSRTDIATLTGRPVPASVLEAEMWFGAHPSGSSSLAGSGRSLVEAIAADPLGQLGATTLERYGERLPYLMKLISVAEPLSLQAHPSADQAAEGHRRGVYGDPWPKPELVCALTPFTALAGFRPAAQAAMLVGRLGVPELDEVVESLEAGTVREGLRRLLGRRPLGERVAWAASAVHHPDYALVARLARRHPGDPACLAPLLLQRYELEPGQALFLGAGVLHCYIGGFGVEIMAGSDNVVRAGLTGKPVDEDELVRIVEPATPALRVAPSADGEYETPAPEFRLSRIRRGGARELAGGVPRILLCTEGTAQAGSLRLRQGQSIFVPAGEPAFTVSADGELFCAEPGGPDPAARPRAR
ncbi:mannose-6-phosphate isomerase, class I [Planomonospora sp. ID67723]|uniref:mannose-6-phosphate isomerase, class I n=1 Tax=Planomonospora sp. ID67723 TaxID=2738134 RepID=UPI0018C3C6E1|nr:mannose-6-phosphate isomerase, class I [Planomonospora sp. ID67723]MBG0827145.1 mannose-6-phosphate isomerase, class I [Planomonospora sp. ID67723]